MDDARQALLEDHIREFEAILEKGKDAVDGESRWILSLVREALADNKLMLSRAKGQA